MRQNTDARFIGAEREQNASVTDVVSQSARLHATLGGLVGSLRAPRSVAVRSLQLLALALSRFLDSSPCVRVASYLSAMATTAVPPSSRCLVQCW